MDRIFHSFPEEFWVYVDKMKLHLKGASMDSPERQGDLNTMLKAHMKKGRFEFSVTEGNKEGKSQIEVSKAHLGQKDASGCAKG